MSNVNFKPNEDRILVEPAPAQKKKLHRESSFLIPQKKNLKKGL